MKLWKIDGHRHPYWMKAPNLAVAAVAVLMMGNGKYGCKLIGGKEEMPRFLIEGSLEAWCESTFRMDLDQLQARVAQGHVIDLAKALGSVRIGEPGDSGFVRPEDGSDLEEDAARLAESVERALMRSLSKGKPKVH